MSLSRRTHPLGAYRNGPDAASCCNCGETVVTSSPIQNRATIRCVSCLRKAGDLAFLTD